MKNSERKSSYDSRRISGCENKKVYEEMLLKELPGNKRPNQPMHAVLESSLDVSSGIREAQAVRNHALIHYLASLANSNNNEDKFDFDFVESLVANGADINSTDKSGQTIFHEVARSWNKDVASFLIEHGANINQQDTFGRSPLHVAAAVDYADMVEFLVKSGADINIATFGEGQMPIHYAAKNDACKSLKMLLGYGANIDSRDSKNRTPLQVAAAKNRSKSSKLLVKNGAPAGVCDNIGNSALSILIEKLPDVAVEALDQLHSVSYINRKEYFFLNYLEGNRLDDPESPVYSALEIAVQNQEFDIILHPVMKRLILVKWQKFGKQGAIFDLIINLIYAVLWTILSASTPSHGNEFYLPWSKNAWRLVMSIIIGLMTADEIRRQVTGVIRTRNRQKKWITWRAAELQDDLAYCHPRWPEEETYLRSEIDAIEDTPLISTGDAWIYFDWFSLILILASIVSHVVYMELDTNLSHVIYLRIITMLLLLLWLRILKYVRPFERAGPFVSIFGHILWDIFNWGLLLIIIAIPFGLAFWITFGKVSMEPVESYSSLSPLLYNMFSMVVVNDHDFDSLEKVDPTMARLLCGSFIGIMAIINLNLLIALLSDTFTRVYGNAVANAVMQRAKTILLLEKSLSSKKKHDYHEFIRNNGSPESVQLNRDISTGSDRDDNKSSDMVKETVFEIHALLDERFGKQYGTGQRSDLDIIRDTLVHIQEANEQEKSNMRMILRSLQQMQAVIIERSASLDLEMPSTDHRSVNDEDNFPRHGEMSDERRPSYDDTASSDSSNSHDGRIHLSNPECSPSAWNGNSLDRGAINERFEENKPSGSGGSAMKMRRESSGSLGWKIYKEHIKGSRESCGDMSGEPRGVSRGTNYLETGDEWRRAPDEKSCGRSEVEQDRTSRGRSPERGRNFPREMPHEKARGELPAEFEGSLTENSRGEPRRKPSRERHAVGSTENFPELSPPSRDGRNHKKKDKRRKDSNESRKPISEIKINSAESKHSPEKSRSDKRGGNSRIQNSSRVKNDERSQQRRHEDELERSSDAWPRHYPEKTDEQYAQFPYSSDDGESESCSEEGKLTRREDDSVIVYSDSDLFQRRRRRQYPKERRYYDRWDDKSVKSVAF